MLNKQESISPGFIEQYVIEQDRRASQIPSYPRETSSLDSLDRAFPAFGNQAFSEVLRNSALKGGADILEVGGGTQQVAALSILQTIPGIRKYLGHEIRPPSNDAAEQLSTHPNFNFRLGGLENFDALVPEKNFDIAFAHDVAEHLPHPFLLVEHLYRRLNTTGVLYVNGILLYNNVADRVLSKWNDDGQDFAIRYCDTDRYMYKSGIIGLNLALRKKSETLYIPTPINRQLTDLSGHEKSTLVYQ